MNHSKEKAVLSFEECIDLFLYTKILSPFDMFPKHENPKLTLPHEFNH